MHAWMVVKANEPLQKFELPTPVPRGSEVLVEVTHAGVCHSDLHFCKQALLDLKAGRVTGRAVLVHETATQP